MRAMYQDLQASSLLSSNAFSQDACSAVLSNTHQTSLDLVFDAIIFALNSLRYSEL